MALAIVNPGLDRGSRPSISEVGFSEIANPSGANIDVVFVHGLQGHPEWTWTYVPRPVKKRRFRISKAVNARQSQTTVFWPFDLLSKHPKLTTARILTWGYDCKVHRFFSANNQENISMHGHNLMVNLERKRKENPLRPLVFVAHSLGGILVKIALNNSRDSNQQPRFLSIYKSTKGIVFIGTPHGGSRAADWGLLMTNLAKFALQGSNDRILRGLVPNGELLQAMSNTFKTTLLEGKIDIHSFYETKGITGLFKMREKIVPRESAEVGLINREIVEAIDGNHSEICKFASKEDAGYTAVSEVIEGYVNKVAELEGRIRNSNLESNKGSNDPGPITIIPLPRNQNFVGRDEIFDKLEKYLISKPGYQAIAALCGLGGIGKTQIALEYAYRLKERSPQCSIFWVYASNADRFKRSYELISSECKIPGREDPNLDSMQLVRDWLDSTYKANWLMVVDNVDEKNEFFSVKTTTGKALREYIPQSPKGHVLYTTRNREIGVDLTPNRNPIEVLPVSPKEAIELLGKDIRDKSTAEEQLKLVEELAYLPLAIIQAAAYMAKRRKGISEYIDLYRRSDSIKIELLRHEFSSPGRDTRGMESLATTWVISFEHIREQNPRAADLLCQMSLLDRQGIPDALLKLKDENQVTFEDGIGTLEAFSLISKNKWGNSYDMHRLVQLATRGWLTESETEKWAAVALEILAAKFPNGEYEHWEICAMYLPHVEAILCHNFKDPDASIKARATLLLNTSWYFRNQGRLEEGGTRAKKSFYLHESAFGKEHPDTLASMDNFGAVLERQGKYSEAEEMHRRALDGMEKALGEAHQDTLRSASNLGVAMWRQGKNKEAEEVHRRALDGREKALGEMHPDTLRSMGDLGVALWSQGKYKEAEEMHRRELDGMEKALGEAHQDTLSSMSSLGIALQGQGKYKESEEMHRQALDRRGKALGEMHPDTLRSMNNLGVALQGQGKYKEAEEMQQRAFDGMKRTLGEAHPDTLKIMSNLGIALLGQDKYNEAEEVHRRAVDGRKKTLGEAHQDTLMSIDNLGVALQGQGKYKEAEEMHRRALDGMEKVLGEIHQDALRYMSNLGVALQDQGKYKEAEEVHRRALGGREKTLGEAHQDTLTSMDNLGVALQDQGKCKEAEEMHRRALDGREKTLGKSHQSALTSIDNLGVALLGQDKYKEAEKMHRRALDGRQKILGEFHQSALTSIDNLGITLRVQGKYKEAEEMHRRALDEREKALGGMHPDTLRSTGNLGVALWSQGKYREAEEMHRRELDGMEKALGEAHQDTLRSMSSLGVALLGQGKYKEAEKMHRRALDGREKALGEAHQDTLKSAGNLGIALGEQGKYKEAEEVHRRAVDGREKTLGESHRSTLTSIDNLGIALQGQGKYKEAEEMHRRALDGMGKALGEAHQDTLRSMNNLRIALREQGKYEEAGEVRRRTLDRKEKALGEAHPAPLPSHGEV